MFVWAGISCSRLLTSASYKTLFTRKAHFISFLDQGVSLPLCKGTRRTFIPVQLYQKTMSMYQGGGSNSPDDGTVRVIDMRSDTITKPTPAMRRAMAEAEVGDDVYGEDPTVNALQEKAAKLFGMEAALFVPTGTMGNFCSIMAHCWERGSEMLLGDCAHIFIYEQGGSAQLGGIHPRTVRNKPDGTFDLDEVESKVRTSDPHLPITRLICVENTQNICGGRVLPLSFLKELRELANRHKLPVHMDGARLMNAAVSLNVPPSDILQYCDSVSVCLSKGLGAPVGSVIGGKKDFIARCVRLRKVLGGGMRQSGILAAAGLLAITEGAARLHEDHENARTIAEGIHSLDPSVLQIDLDTVQSNIIVFQLVSHAVTPGQFCKMLNTYDPNDSLDIDVRVSMLATDFKRDIRCVTHHHISADDAQLVLKKFRAVVGRVAGMKG
ncbi:probable low-specificity L-threonine aldolase 2 isoform X1 [Branchiostoma floridae]|nr:probable low-specificity L-threonine aldolase 2 isoform X1 [Branchiostoma floridae]